MDRISFFYSGVLYWEEFDVDGGLQILFYMLLASVSLCLFWLLAVWYVMFGNFVCCFLVKLSSPFRACPLLREDFFVGRESLAN